MTARFGYPPCPSLPAIIMADRIPLLHSAALFGGAAAQLQAVLQAAALLLQRDASLRPQLPQQTLRLLLVSGPARCGKSGLVSECLAACCGPGVLTAHFSALSLATSSPGDPRGAASRLIGEVALAVATAAAAAAPGPGLIPLVAPLVVVLDDLHAAFPPPSGEEEDASVADAARILIRGLRRLAAAVAAEHALVPVLLVGVAQSGCPLHPAIAALFAGADHVCVPPLTPTCRGVLLAAACRHYGLCAAVARDDEKINSVAAVPAPQRWALLDDATARRVGVDACHGYALGDVVAVARDAAIFIAAVARYDGGGGGTPFITGHHLRTPTTLSVEALLLRLIAGRVPAPMGATADNDSMSSTTFMGHSPPTDGSDAGGAQRRAWELDALATVPACVDALDACPAWMLPPPPASARARAAGNSSSSSGGQAGKRAADGEEAGGGLRGGSSGGEGGGGGDSLRALLEQQRSQLQQRPVHAVSTWDAGVGGAAAAKRALHELVLWPLAHAAAVRRAGISLPAGVLLYGPSGTGKTLLARAVASAFGARFLSLPIPLVLRSGVGDSERALVAAFQLARDCAPCVVFIDELQALFTRRDGGGGGGDDEGGRMAGMLTSTLLQCMDGVAQRRGRGGESDGPAVLVLAATNVPEALDPAMLRPGRFDRAVHVGLPDEGERAAILRPLVARLAGAGAGVSRGSPPAASATPGDGDSVDIEGVEGAAANGGGQSCTPSHPPHLPSTSSLPALVAGVAAATPGFSGADLANLVRTAGSLSVGAALQRRQQQQQQQQQQQPRTDGGNGDALGDAATHLWEALRRTAPSCSPQRAAALAAWHPRW